MSVHQFEFPSVADYLHHRPPYLMVDRILDIRQEEILTEKIFTGDEFFARGHFPGATVMPGAMMQEVSTQSAGILIAAKHNPMEEYNTHDPHFNEFALGVLVRVKYAKYRGFVRPGDKLLCRVTLQGQIQNMFDFATSITVGEQTVMQNAFQLANIKSATLTA